MPGEIRGSDLAPESDVRFAILDVIYTYCELMDKFEFDKMARLVFAEDASENHGLGLATVHGRQEIAQLFTKLMQPYEGAMHNVSNTRFEEGLDGTVLTRTYFQAYHWLKQTGPDPMRPVDLMTTGEYQDVFTLTDDGWRIKDRVRNYVGPGPIGFGSIPAHVQGAPT